MNKKRAIEALEDLIYEIDENWDKEEYCHEIKENIEALEYAIKIIKTSNKQVGTLLLNGKEYFITK